MVNEMCAAAAAAYAQVFAVQPLADGERGFDHAANPNSGRGARGSARAAGCDWPTLVDEADVTVARWMSRLNSRLTPDKGQ
jgi:hypothetical protein